MKACEVPSAWVSLDEDDNDLRIFLSYFVSVIQRIFPAACAEALSMLSFDHLPPVSLLAGSLINELDRIEKSFILVPDDEQQWFRYHHLFQALLKRQLKKRFKAEEIVTIHSIVVEYVEVVFYRRPMAIFAGFRVPTCLQYSPGGRINFMFNRSIVA